MFFCSSSTTFMIIISGFSASFGAPDIAHKLQHFLWWVSLHAITVKANLRRRRINIYVAQERKQGTVSFFFCPYTEVIWRISPIHPTHIICYPTITIDNIKSFFSFHTNTNAHTESHYLTVWVICHMENSE